MAKSEPDLDDFTVRLDLTQDQANALCDALDSHLALLDDVRSALYEALNPDGEDPEVEDENADPLEMDGI